MRWKFTREGGNMYLCCGCLHVKHGTISLGIFTLLMEVAFVIFMSCLFIRPEVMPPWATCFMWRTSSEELNLKPRHAGWFGNGMMHGGYGGRHGFGGMWGGHGRGYGHMMDDWPGPDDRPGPRGMMDGWLGPGDLMDGPADMMGYGSPVGKIVDDTKPTTKKLEAVKSTTMKLPVDKDSKGYEGKMVDEAKSTTVKLAEIGPDSAIVKGLEGDLQMPMFGRSERSKSLIDWSDMPHMKDSSRQTFEEMARMMKESGMPGMMDGSSSPQWFKEMSRFMKDNGMPYMMDGSRQSFEEMERFMKENDMPYSFDDMADHMRDMLRYWKDAAPRRSGEMGPGMMVDVGVKGKELIPKKDDDDDRPLISDNTRGHFAFRRARINAFNSDDKVFVFVFALCCITASILLIFGILKGHPGYMVPFMGLQVFGFCATCLMVVTCFSYVPNIKRWILELPDAFPWKSSLMAANTDRLMLFIIFVSITILVVKAYLMAMVWSCYKYVRDGVGQQTAGHRRRAGAEDVACNPEDSELLLPPKYEELSEPQSADGAVTVAIETGSSQSQPPPYAAAE